PVLLRELLAVEVEYRCKSGEGPTPEEYRQRFPEHTELIQDILARAPRPETRDTPGAAAAVSDTAERPAAPGQPATPTVPGYEILGELGRGGFGVVYRARQVRPNRVVALKMIRANSNAGAKELRLFRQEAQATADLQDPNIVPIYEVGEHNGLPFFSMELCAGGSLSARLSGQPLPPREAAALVQTLARAGHTAHEAGIIHRDLKPANVVLASGGHPSANGESELPGTLPEWLPPPLAWFVPKITDFGLARRLDADVRHTQTGAVAGSPPYMAPEQVQGKAGYIGPATDVYGLGAVLYELLTGRPPFQGVTVME